MIMKKILLGAMSLFALTSAIQAQEMEDKYATIPCEHAEIHKQLVQLNNVRLNEGAKLSMFQVIKVPSKAYVPVLVSVEKGKKYALNIVADQAYRNLKITMIDGDKKEILKAEANHRKGDQSFINQEFVAQETGQYWLILHQSIKKGSPECLGIGIIALN